MALEKKPAQPKTIRSAKSSKAAGKLDLRKLTLSSATIPENKKIIPVAVTIPLSWQT